MHPCVPIVEYVVCTMLRRILASMEDKHMDEKNEDIYDPNRARVYRLRLEAPTINWIMEVVRVNLQNASKHNLHQSPLLDEYASRATLELSKLIGIISTEHSSKVWYYIFCCFCDSTQVITRNNTNTYTKSIHLIFRYNQHSKNCWMDAEINQMNQ